MKTVFGNIHMTLDGDTGKTQIWNVVTNSNLFILGTVQWFARWRAYVFYPNYNTVYCPDCLISIAAFIRELMAERRAG